MEASTSNEDGSFAKELEDELMKFTTNNEENRVDAYLDDQTEKIHKNTDIKFNMMECLKSGGNEAECADASECSSSFDEYDLSDFHGDAESDLVDTDGSGKLYKRRKKLSSHWRSFIHPIMWRCKWLELQIKKLEAQAQRYDRKLEEYSRKSTFEGVGIKPLRRKKRRRAEETNNRATCMSHHNLFSYYENRKIIREAACRVLKNPDASHEVVNINDESWDKDELLSAEDGNDDELLEPILRKIDQLHSKVAEMKTRVDKVKGQNAGSFSCTDNLTSTVALNSSTSSPTNTGRGMSIGTYIAYQLMSGALIPENAVLNHGGVAGDANGSSNHAHFAHAHGIEDDAVLIDNQRAREEMHYLQGVKIHTNNQRPWMLKDGLDSTNPPVRADPVLVTDDQPPPQTRSAPNLANASRSNNKRDKAW